MWSLPTPALFFLLFVEISAAILTAVELLRTDVTTSDLRRLALLAVLSGTLAKIVDRVEQSHRQLASGPTVDATSVWIFAAVLLLPGAYAASLAALIYAHTLIRHRHEKSWRPHRIVFTCGAMMLSALAADAIANAFDGIHGLPPGAAPALGVVLALLGFSAVNDVTIITVMYLVVRPPRIRDVLVGPDDLGVELATLILGAFTAQTIIQMPWLTPAVLVLVVMMYRGLLVKKLEVAAATDGKTGLFNATAWRELAQRHLSRAIREQQAAALLVIDLDRFKTLNDQHGHLAGDVALKTVADRIKHELRDYDAVGRYGGEEFVALLPNAGANAAMRVAERVRARIEDEPITTEDGTALRLTGSVGVATYPTHGGELDALIRSADRAMYAAKDAGRNAVRLAYPSLTSHESQGASA